MLFDDAVSASNTASNEMGK